MYKKIFLIAIILCTISFRTFSQVDTPPPHHLTNLDDSEEENLEDNSNSEIPLEKQIGWEPEYTEQEKKINWLTGLSTPLVPPAILFTWNKFMIGAGWTQVTWETITSDRYLEFDGDWYWTNFVLHPYQGALTYMGARNSNFNPLASFFMSVIQSTIWEYFCEANQPSINDMVYTPIGGFAIGEMFYRLSIEASDVWLPLGFFVNPMRVYTDFTTRHKPRGPHNNINKFNISVYCNSTYGTSFPNGYINLSEFYPALLGFETYIEYRNPYGHESNSPYSQFELNFGGGAGIPSGIGYKEEEKYICYDIHIFSNGMIKSWALPEETKTLTTLAISMIYDFVWRNIYEFTSLAPCFAIKQRVDFENKNHIDWQSHLGIILLGTTDNFFYRRNVLGHENSYSYTSGVQYSGYFKYFWEKGNLDCSLRSYFMIDLPDSYSKTEAVGTEFINVATTKYEFPLKQNVSLGFSYELYFKHSWYKNLPEVSMLNHTAGIYFKINFVNPRL